MIKHFPVLVNEILNYIKPEYKYFFDGTLGHGGHATYILDKYKNIEKYIGVDRDFNMLEIAKKNLRNFFDKIIFYENTYDKIDEISNKLNIKFDFIFLDLGVNLQHFKDPLRGFSIKLDGPLDMRFDKNNNFTAKDLIYNYNIQQLKNIFIKYGDFPEKLAEKIANRIIIERQKILIDTTLKLKYVLKSIGLSEKKISVIFQAIRIEVNKELDILEKFLDKFYKFLNTGGRCYIITYHSIEDRIVKNAFKYLVKFKNGYKLVNKHVIRPTWDEIKINKPSRSAKLRIIEKV